MSDRLRVRKTITAFAGLTTGNCFRVGAGLPLDSSVDALARVVGDGVLRRLHPSVLVRLHSETAESINPHDVGRAFGITAPLSGLALNLGLPRVVESHGWPAWMSFAGLCCFGVAALVALGRGPWWPRGTALRDPDAHQDDDSEAASVPHALSPALRR